MSGEATYNRANDSKSISPNRGTPAKRVGNPFTDLPVATLVPTATNPAENVTGARGFGVSSAVQPAPAAPITPAVDSSSVGLGTDEWQAIQLAKAITALKQKFAGVDLSQPFFKNEYDKALQAEADSIRAQAATDRATMENSQANRDVTTKEGDATRATQASEGALDREAQLKMAKENAKAQEKSSLWGGLGQLGAQAALTPYGGHEGRLIGIDPATGQATYEPSVAPASLFGKGMKALGAGSKSAWETLNTPNGYSSANVLPNGPVPAAASSVSDPVRASLSSSNSSGIGDLNYVPPSVSAQNGMGLGTMLGTGAGGAAIGSLIPGKGNVLGKFATGMGMTGLNYGLDSVGGLGTTGPWGNLISSGLASWANPFSGTSWNKANRDKTLLKLGGAALAGRFL